MASTTPTLHASPQTHDHPRVVVVLMGLRASGKTTVGRHMAEMLGGTFVDLDELVARALGATSVREAWERAGEGRFREAEADELETLLSARFRSQGPTVVALGGGTPTHVRSARALERASAGGLAHPIYLRCDPPILQGRLAAEGTHDRPPLLGRDAIQEVPTIHAIRDGLFRALAWDVVDAGADARAVAQRVAQLVTQPRACGRADAIASSDRPGLLQLRGMSAGRLRGLLRRARYFRNNRERAAGGTFQGLAQHKRVALLFLENSTRTRLSFGLACEWLGARPVDFSAGTSSVAKGESLVDTALTVAAMGVDALVVRARSAGVPHLLQARTGLPVINAGDGAHEHPTQGLLDALALAEAMGIDGPGPGQFDFRGRRLVIVGDLMHSRVARSAIACLGTLGASIDCCGPANLCPPELADLGCAVHDRLDPLLAHADAVMMLRVQFERHTGAAGAGVPWTHPFVRDFREHFALTGRRAALLKPSAVVMHPGPVNRGLELDADVLDGPRSIVLSQVSCGVAVRAAVLARALRVGAEDDND